MKCVNEIIWDDIRLRKQSERQISIAHYWMSKERKGDQKVIAEKMERYAMPSHMPVSMLNGLLGTGRVSLLITWVQGAFEVCANVNEICFTTLYQWFGEGGQSDFLPQIATCHHCVSSSRVCHRRGVWRWPRARTGRKTFYTLLLELLGGQKKVKKIFSYSTQKAAL